MLGFVVIGSVMVLVCLAGLLIPLSRNKTADDPTIGNFNVDIAREKLAEFDRQLHAGEISEDTHADLTDEIQSTLIAEAPDPVQPEYRNSNPLPISILVTALIPVISLVLYLALGNPEGINHEPQRISQKTPDGQDIDALLANLEQKLLTNPDDAQGWALLGRSYMSLQRFAKAHQAFSNLRRIQGDTPANLLQLADAETMLNGGVFTPASRSGVFRVLDAEPDNVQAIWMAAMIDVQEGNTRAAIPRWEKLLGLFANQPEQQQRVERLLAEARASLNDAQPADENTQDSLSVTVSVRLARQLPATAREDQTVYVYARAADGPPMPLAVKQIRVADLPADITLTESDAMIADMTIATFPQLVVGARISISGQPTAQPGDIQTLSQPLTLPLASPLVLEIGELVE